MIRLRDTRGAVIPLPPGVRFFEITDLQGKIAKLIFIGEDGSINEVTSADKESQRYTQLMNVEFCPIVRLPREIIQPSE